MMQAMNADLLNGAADQERDPNILRLAVEHGAWCDITDEVITQACGGGGCTKKRDHSHHFGALFQDGNTPLHLAVMACPSEADARHEAAMMGLQLKSSMEPLGGTMKSEFKLPGLAARDVTQKIKAFTRKLQRNSDILDVLCRVGMSDPYLKNNAGKNCFDLALGHFPYILHQMEEQVVHLEHVAEQEALAEEDEEYDVEPYVWKTDHTDLADIEGRASRAYINAQLDLGMFSKARGEAKSSSMHTSGGVNDYTVQNESRIS